MLIVLYICFTAFWFYALNKDVLPKAWFEVSNAIVVALFLFASSTKLAIGAVYAFKNSSPEAKPFHKWLSLLLSIAGFGAVIWWSTAYSSPNIDVLIAISFGIVSLLVIGYAALFDLQGRFKGLSNLFSTNQIQTAKPIQSVTKRTLAENVQLTLRFVFLLLFIVCFVIWMPGKLNSSLVWIDEDLIRALLGISFTGFWWFNKPVSEEEHKQTQTWRTAQMCFLVTGFLFTIFFLVRFMLTPQHPVFASLLPSVFGIVEIVLFAVGLASFNENHERDSETNTVAKQVQKL